MKKYISCILFSKAILFAGGLEVNLDKAIELALKNNHQKKISTLNLKIAQAMYAQAQSANYPMLDLNITATRKDENSNFDMRGDITLPQDVAKDLAFVRAFRTATSNGASTNIATNAGNYAANSILTDAALPLDTKVKILGRDTIYGSLDLVYPLYTGGKITSLINQAKLNTQLKQEDIKIQENELIYNVKKIYFSYILSLKIYETMKKSYEKMLIVKQLTENLYKSDSLKVKKTDFLKVNVTVSLMKAKLESFKSNIQITKNALKNLLAIPQSESLTITDKSFPKKYLKKIFKDKNFSNKDLANNLDLKKLALAIKISEEKIKESKSSYFPTISLFANVTKFYNDMDSGLYTDENRNAWTIGVNLKFNIFSGFKTKNEYEQYMIEKQKLLQTNKLLNDALELQVKNEFIKSDEILNTISNYEKAVKDAKEHRDLNIKAYEIDMVETKDVIEAQIIQARSEVMYYNSKFDYLISIANIDRLLTNNLKERN